MPLPADAVRIDDKLSKLPEDAVRLDQDQASVASPSQYLSSSERAKTGFRVNPEEYLDQQRAQRGLRPGTPLEPTPGTTSLISNIKDIPNDFLDILGPAFPAIVQVAAGSLAAAATIPTTGGLASPAAVASAGVGGAITGEMLRQGIGEWLNLEDKPLTERAKRVALEGALGVAGEGAYLAGSSLLRATKKGLVSAGKRALSKKGLEGFVKGFGRITRNFGPDEFQHALRSIESGDNAVLKKAFASKEYADDFTQSLFFGKDLNAAGQIRKLSTKKEAKLSVKQLYKEFLGLDGETIDMAMKYGKNISKFDNKNVIGAIREINRLVPKAFDDLGKQLGKARNELAERVPGAEVSDFLSSANSAFAKKLEQVGLLKEVAPEVYEIASDYIVTSQGRTQSRSLMRYIDKLFGKSKEVGSLNLARLEKMILEGADESAIKKITRGKYFTTRVGSKFGEFSSKLRSLEAQISGKEFYELGKLSPSLTEYIRGLREITGKVADQYGDIAVKSLLNEYRDLAVGAELIRSGSKVKSVEDLSKVFSKYLNPKDVIEEQQGKQLERFLKKNFSSDVFEKVRGFKAAKALAGIETDITKTSGRQRLVNLMKEAFSEGNSVLLDSIEKQVDPFLPKNLKIALNAKNHTTAAALQKDALSIIKARFLSSGLGLPGIVGGLTGGALGGYQGATIGLVAGIGLQNPKILQMLMKMAAKAPEERALQVPLKEFSRNQTVIATQLLEGLLSQNQ